jgi:hypothetical protein
MISDDIKAKLTPQELGFLEAAVEDARVSQDGEVGMGGIVIGHNLPIPVPTGRNIIRKLEHLGLVDVHRWDVIGGPSFRVAPELLDD